MRYQWQRHYWRLCFAPSTLVPPLLRPLLFIAASLPLSRGTAAKTLYGSLPPFMEYGLESGLQIAYVANILAWAFSRALMAVPLHAVVLLACPMARHWYVRLGLRVQYATRYFAPAYWFDPSVLFTVSGSIPPLTFVCTPCSFKCYQSRATSFDEYRVLLSRSSTHMESNSLITLSRVLLAPLSCLANLCWLSGIICMHAMPFHKMLCRTWTMYLDVDVLQITLDARIIGSTPYQLRSAFDFLKG
ncbi:hypothetical protein EDB86DRAFT_2832773 [Lactarius hatsudake]|nr:hypothetical protein EDB86DRAFT_2832773 [Lactarius hatsudake]